MPEIDKTPKQLRPYTFHGLDLDTKDDKQGVGQCPFCTGENKFSVNIEKGQYRCWVCAEGTEKGGGNTYTFLRSVWKYSDEQKGLDLQPLATHRKLLSSDTLMYWEVVRSFITQDWLIPGYGTDKKLNQLYKYVQLHDKSRLYPTPEMPHQLHGVNLYDKKKDTIYLLEGCWDAMALWEVLRQARVKDDGKIQGLEVTASQTNNMLADANVLAVPGCNVFQQSWSSLFAGKRVVLMYDSDHPKPIPNTNRTTPSAGYAGMQRVAQMLATAEEPPESILYLNWGNGSSEGYNPSKPSGYDVRDYLTQGKDIEQRVNLLRSLLDMIEPIPTDWVKGRSKKTASSGGTEIDCLECTSWKELTTQWRKALKWTEGLERALSCMLACVVSTKAVGDQLWFKVIGPAACGKSTLCEALSVNKKYIVAKSAITGFHSGFKTDKDGSKDNSLISMVYDKTLITKDGDTLMQSPNVEQILSEARDLYDSTSRKFYRHGLNRDYEGVRMTWILCGTASLRAIDISELGERFLTTVIMEEIPDDLEDEILWRVVKRTAKNMGMVSGKKGDSQHDPELLRAMQLTGGYITYLRENAETLLSELYDDEDETLRQVARMGKFTSYMRARPSVKQNEEAERELGSRLASQLTRLGKCLAVVLNRKAMDTEVLRRVKAVAMDTSRGKTIEIVRRINEEGPAGMDTHKLGILSAENEKEMRPVMQFMRKIGIIEHFRVRIQGVVNNRPRWRLTDRFKKLYDLVTM